MIRVTVWNEYYHEKQDGSVYPQGIHGALKEMLGREEDLCVRTVTMEDEQQGLSERVLDETDVLLWWGHAHQNEITDENARRVAQHVLDGMGFIPLHASRLSKPFRLLTGTSGRARWRENNERERVWVIEPSHPITKGLPPFFEIEQEETYGECFDTPTPDEVVFISWFSGGEVFRSGCCYHRGRGRIFYFQPGHEEYPIYYREEIVRVLVNAVRWAAPTGGPVIPLGQSEAPEKRYE